MKLTSKPAALVAAVAISGCGNLVERLNEARDRAFHSEESNAHPQGTYKDCRELKEAVDQMTAYAQMKGYAPWSADASAEQSVTSGVDNQEENVSEGDIVQVGEKAIYYLRGLDLIVVDRTSLQEVQTLTAAAATATGSIGLTPRNEQLFLEGETLAAVLSFGQRSIIANWHIEADGRLRALTSKTVDGSIEQARLIAGRLLLHTQVLGLADVLGRGAVSGVQCNNIVGPKQTPIIQSESFLPTIFLSVYSSYALADLENLQSVCLLDEASPTVYVADEKVFSSVAVYRNQQSTLNLRLLDYDRNSGSFTVSAQGSVPGAAVSRWAYKYRKGSDTLVVATTENQWSADQSNSLYAVKQKGTSLEIIHSLQGLGKKEDIRSVRYVGDTAYFVTFKKTDPLFAVDISDVSNFKIVGELKVPGFSTMLYPFGEGKMVGVGFDAEEMGEFAFYQGIKVSLYSVSSTVAPTEMNTHVIGSRGTYSEAALDSHGAFVDPSSGVFALSYRRVGEDGVHTSSETGTYRDSGIQLYKLSGERLEEGARFSHVDMMTAECKDAWSRTLPTWWSQALPFFADITRMRRIDGRLVMISPFGVSSVDEGTGMETKRQSFSASTNLCLTVLTSFGKPD